MLEHAATFVFSAYAIGVALLLGFAIWNFWQRRHLRQWQAALSQPSPAADLAMTRDPQPQPHQEPNQ